MKAIVTLLLYISCLAFSSELVKGQLITSCSNSDFNLGNFTDWTGCYGNFANPCLTPGILTTGSHPPFKMIPAPGWIDVGNTCDSLVNMFPGNNYVARLGDTVYTSSASNHKAAELKYAVSVNTSSYLFIYRYAVVLQNYGHPLNQQPDFRVAITNASGTILDSTCGYYYIIAPTDPPPPPGWHLCPSAPTVPTYWKDWTTVGMDLTPYFGQTIYITFRVRGCTFNTHFGYACVTAYCSYLTIQTAMCQGDSTATLTAPPGFAHYLWSTGDTVPSIVVPHPTTGDTYNCLLTALNGCQNTIYITLTYTVIHSNFTHGPACSGIPTQFNDSSYVNQNFVTGWKWDFGDGTVIVTGNANPQHTFALPGTYNVKLVSNSTEGCKDSITKSVTVDTLPALTNNPNWKKICSRAATNVLLTSNTTGTNFTWTATSGSPLLTGWSSNTTVPTTIINQVLTNTDNKIDTVTYHLTPHSANCNGFVANYKVAVKPLPVLTNTVLIKSICDSTSTNIVLLSNNDSTLFTWTCTASSPNLSGYSNNTLVPGTLINQVIYNSGFSIDTVFYHIVPHSFGCLGDTSIYKVIVFPFPDLSNTPLTKSICNNTSTNITLTSHVTGTLFTWTCSPSSGNLSGFSNNATPTTILDQTLYNSCYTPETVTYVIVPHANGCTGHSSNFVVTVFPVPDLSNTPASKQICNNTSTNILLTSDVAGTLFTWTATGSSPNLGGFSNNAVPGTLLNQTLTNSGFTPEIVTYHILPAANGCTGPVSDFAVTVYPVPDVSNNPLSSQICSGTSTNIGLQSHVTGATFSWTATGSSPNVTGFGPGSGLVLNQTLANLGLTVETVTYHITPAANGCSGQLSDYVVTVYPIPDVYFIPPAQSVCSGQSSNIQIMTHVNGATFTWTASGSSPNLSGFSAGTGNLISQVILNSGNTTESVTYVVTPSAFGCSPGPSQNVILTVFPTPLITNSATNFQQCNLATTSIILQSSVPGSTFTWTASGSSPNVTGFSAGSGPSINQTLHNSGFNIETVTYVVTAHANGCAGVPMNFVVTVFPVPDVYFTPPSQTICSGMTSEIQNQSHVTGASFTWTASGSSGNVSGFSPGSGNLVLQTLVNSGYSIESVTYHVTPAANGCTGSPANVIVTVDPLPVVTLTVCWDPVTTTDAQPIPLKGGIPRGGIYSSLGINTGIFYPGIAGAGGHTIVYTYINGFGCNSNASQTITVIPPAAFTCGNPLTDIRDNQVYNTVQIGIQCWMAANLNFGNTITYTQMQRDNCISEKYCYNDIPLNCSSEGGLYQWDEVMKFANTPGIQGFCPPGWHIPTENEWGVLFKYFISYGFAGSPLKYTGYSGFDAFLSGINHENKVWSYNTFSIMYWSSTFHGPKKAWAHGMNTYNPSVSYYPSLKSNAFATRCIKD